MLTTTIYAIVVTKFHCIDTSLRRGINGIECELVKIYVKYTFGTRTHIFPAIKISTLGHI